VTKREGYTEIIGWCWNWGGSGSGSAWKAGMGGCLKMGSAVTDRMGKLGEREFYVCEMGK